MANKTYWIALQALENSRITLMSKVSTQCYHEYLEWFKAQQDKKHISMPSMTSNPTGVDSWKEDIYWRVPIGMIIE